MANLQPTSVTRPWGVMLATLAGTGATAVGLAGQTWILGATGLAVTLAGAATLWRLLGEARAEATQRQALLEELNHNLDEQVQTRTQRLMQTIEDLESFNRMVTHDLRSPLTGLMAGMELLELRLGKSSDPETRGLVQDLKDSADRMQDLVQDLRQLAMISGRIPAIQQVDLTHHASLVLRHLQQKEPHRKVRWTLEPGLTVYGDGNLIRIALENVLGNAWKYSLEADPAEIQVRRAEGEGVIIEIRDNGSGFDMNRADKLFQPFQRMHDDPKYPGSGIGLSIVKRVMARHGGTITAESTPGQGSAFQLHFPAGLDPNQG